MYGASSDLLVCSEPAKAKVFYGIIIDVTLKNKSSQILSTSITLHDQKKYKNNDTYIYI